MEESVRPEPGSCARPDLAGPTGQRSRPGPSRRSLAPEVVDARARLDLPDLIVLALRRERNRLGLSQRDLAAMIGTSSSAIGRLETTPGATSLDRLLQVLRAADLDLVLVRSPPDQQGVAKPGSALVTRDEWQAVDLLARDVRGRRYPGHGTTTRTDGPPRWLPLNHPGWDPRSIWWVWRQPT